MTMLLLFCLLQLSELQGSDLCEFSKKKYVICESIGKKESCFGFGMDTVTFLAKD